MFGLQKKKNVRDSLVGKQLFLLFKQNNIYFLKQYYQTT